MKDMIKDVDIMKISVVFLAILFGIFGLINGYVAFLFVLSTCKLKINLKKQRKRLF